MTEQEELQMYLDEQMIQELREERQKEEELAYAEYMEEMKNNFELLPRNVLSEVCDIDLIDNELESR